MWGKAEPKNSGLDGVLAGYKKISEAPDDAGDTSLYKSIDDKTGIVYLVRNPASWAISEDSTGRATRIRPLAIKQGHISDLPREKPTSAPALPAWGEI